MHKFPYIIRTQLMVDNFFLLSIFMLISIHSNNWILIIFSIRQITKLEIASLSKFKASVWGGGDSLFKIPCKYGRKKIMREKSVSILIPPTTFCERIWLNWRDIVGLGMIVTPLKIILYVFCCFVVNYVCLKSINFLTTLNYISR